jgi:hypothetical protein
VDSLSKKGAALLRELAMAAIFAMLSLAISWPLARDFTTALTGSGLDAMSHLWGVWHAAQALLGREPFFSTSLLYYPAGTSLLLHSAGPVAGALAFPFWPLGPIAAYNGGLVAGLTLTGYAMYLLARDLGCSRAASFCAGVILLSAPEHLVGLRGHLEKVFLGLMPLAFLALRRAHDPRQSIGWSAAFGVVSLLLLLHSPFQFVQVALSAPLITVAALAVAQERRQIWLRAGAAALAAAIIAGPLVAAIAHAANDPAMAIDRSMESVGHQPDLVQFVLPPTFSRVFGEWSAATLTASAVRPEVETEAAIPLAALALGAVALVHARRAAGAWIAIGVFGILLSIGPSLRIAGVDTTMPMPYAWIAALPGLDFLRTPARFMQVAFVGIAAAAGVGFGTLTRDGRRWVTVTAIVLLALLVEVWPRPWPTVMLPRVPALYAALAHEDESYGVLDLPIRPLPEWSPIDYSARYQVLQMTHGKGIAGGFISRTYRRHPVAPCIFEPSRVLPDIRVDGVPSQCEPAAIYQLASRGYRYVVWHLPATGTRDDRRASFAGQDSEAFVAAAFGGRAADVSDETFKAWRIPTGDTALPAAPVVELMTGWYPAEPNWRWAQSPATLRVTSPRRMTTELVIDVALLHGLGTPVGLGQSGVLVVTAGAETVSVLIEPGETVRVPIALTKGETAVTLALGAGNFRPSDYGQEDARVLSVAITSIDLATESRNHGRAPTP